MDTVDLAQAKARLSELLDKVEAGQEVLITRRGKAVRICRLPLVPGRRSRSRNWPSFGPPCPGRSAPPQNCCARCGTKGADTGGNLSCAISTPVSWFPSSFPRTPASRSPHSSSTFPARIWR